MTYTTNDRAGNKRKCNLTRVMIIVQRLSRQSRVCKFVEFIEKKFSLPQTAN